MSGDTHRRAQELQRACKCAEALRSLSSKLEPGDDYFRVGRNEQLRGTLSVFDISGKSIGRIARSMLFSLVGRGWIGNDGNGEYTILPAGFEAMARLEKAVA